MSHITNKKLLAALLDGPYSDFKKIGQDDWRDPSENNASFSISSKGYTDHKSGTSGSLYDLVQKHNLWILNKHQPASINQSRTPEKKSSPVNIQRIWEQSRVADHPESKSATLIRSYLSDYRKIPFEFYFDLLRKKLIRMNEFRGERMLVYPSLCPQTSRDAIDGKSYQVTRIQRIAVDNKGSKIWKKHLGASKGEAAAFVIPPLQKSSKKMAVIVEGLEDALSIRTDSKEPWIFVAADKAGLKRTAGFFQDGRFTSCLIIADHDTDENSVVTGQALAWKLGEQLKSMGIEIVKVKMHPDPKYDANQALQEDKLIEWMNSLIEIPEQFRIDDQETKKSYGNLRIQKASEVKTRPIKWLWPGVLAAGKLIIIAGDPGLGKSQVSLFVCATVTTGGIWPVSGETCEKGNVLILSAEDGAADTIVPRLTALNAELERIHIVHAVLLGEGKERAFNITRDMERLKRASECIGNVRLIVIDPLSAYLGNTNSHSNAEVRAALTPVVEFADGIGACLLCVSHLNKGGQGSNALNRVTGSIAFIAAARASYVVTKDTGNHNRRLMLPLKNNLAKDTHGFGYRIEETNVTGITTSCVSWEDAPVNLSAEDVLSAQGRPDNQGRAEDFLLQELTESIEVPCKELYERAKAKGISKKVLWSIKDKIGVIARKDGFKGGWVWYLPFEATLEDSQPPKVPEDSLKNNGNLRGIFDKKESSQTAFTEVMDPLKVEDVEVF